MGADVYADGERTRAKLNAAKADILLFVHFQELLGIDGDFSVFVVARTHSILNAQSIQSLNTFKKHGVIRIQKKNERVLPSELARHFRNL